MNKILSCKNKIIKIKLTRVKIRVEAPVTWYDVETEGAVHISRRSGEVGSRTILGCFNLSHIPTFIMG